MLTKDSRAKVEMADKPLNISGGSGEREEAEESVPVAIVVEVHWV